MWTTADTSSFSVAFSGFGRGGGAQRRRRKPTTIIALLTTIIKNKLNLRPCRWATAYERLIRETAHRTGSRQQPSRWAGLENIFYFSIRLAPRPPPYPSVLAVAMYVVRVLLYAYEKSNASETIFSFFFPVETC